MSVEHVVVIGATGDVGRGVVSQAISRGWRVTAVGRRLSALDVLAAEYPGSDLRVVAADVGTLQGSQELVSALEIDEPCGIVNAISRPWKPVSVLETDFDEASSFWQEYLGAHHAVLRTFIPKLLDGSVFIGIGGGMADFAAPGMAVVSMAQAAERMLYRTLHEEISDRDLALRELMIVSKVRGHSNRESASVTWLSDTQIGQRVCEILADPGAVDNVGPILKLKPER